MGKIRYQASHVSTPDEPMGCLGSTGCFEVEDQGAQEATDRAAYLIASNEPGELRDLARVPNNGGVIWQQGMPIPGELITADMVGMTFTAAIRRTLSCYQD